MKNIVRSVCVALVIFTIAISHDRWAPYLEQKLGLNKKKPAAEVVEEKLDPKAMVSIGGGEEFVEIDKLQADQEGGTFSRAIAPTPEPEVKPAPKKRSVLSVLFGIPSPQEVEQNFAEVGKKLSENNKPKTKVIYRDRPTYRYPKNKKLSNRYGTRQPLRSTLKKTYPPRKAKKYWTPIPSRYGLRKPMESTLKKKRRRYRDY